MVQNTIGVFCALPSSVDDNTSSALLYVAMPQYQF